MDSKKGKKNVYQKKMVERNEGLLKKRNRKWEDSWKKKKNATQIWKGEKEEGERMNVNGHVAGVEREREKRGVSMMMMLML
jgi:protein-disulfide isomerase